MASKRRGPGDVLRRILPTLMVRGAARKPSPLCLRPSEPRLDVFGTGMGRIGVVCGPPGERA